MKKQNSAPSPLETMRHGCSHLLAAAVQLLYPQTKFGIGPAIEDGFYYDFDFPQPLNENDLVKIEKTMRQLQAKKLLFERKEANLKEALKTVNELGQNYKADLIKKLEKEGEKKVSFYCLGDFVDLCRGPHVTDTGEIGAFKLLSLAGAYWQGDEKNKMLTRIYGTCFATKKELEEYLIQYEEAKKRDHRLLGKKLNLFMFDDEVGPGLPLWKPKGAFVRHKVMEFAFNTYLERGYQPVVSPHIASEGLWGHSGHLNFYSESMYAPFGIDETSYRLKPMNCPFHLKIYNSETRSYRDLPIRFAEMGTVYRYEKSGTLHGLTRVRGFTQDDAHIICTPDQLHEELVNALKLTLYILRSFGFKDFETNLSVRDPENKEKYIGSEKGWQLAEKQLKEALAEVGFKKFVLDVGGAVFYGPKIDVKVTDALGRKWQLSTIQVDFNLPGRFNINYIGQDGKKHVPFMIHRALLGSLERFMGVFIEHCAGAFPVWLAPTQAVIIPIADKHLGYAKKVAAKLADAQIRYELDSRAQTASAKIRDAQIQKIPYLLIVGDKEIAAGAVALRRREEKNTTVLKLAQFIEKAKDAIAKKSDL